MLRSHETRLFLVLDHSWIDILRQDWRGTAGKVCIAAIHRGDRMRSHRERRRGERRFTANERTRSQHSGAILKCHRPVGVPVVNDFTVAVKVTGFPYFE